MAMTIQDMPVGAIIPQALVSTYMTTAGVMVGAHHGYGTATAGVAIMVTQVITALGAGVVIITHGDTGDMDMAVTTDMVTQVMVGAATALGAHHMAIHKDTIEVMPIIAEDVDTIMPILLQVTHVRFEEDRTQLLQGRIHQDTEVLLVGQVQVVALQQEALEALDQAIPLEERSA